MSRTKTRHRLFHTQGASLFSYLLAIASVFFVVVLYYYQNPFLEAFEAKTYDLRFKYWRGPIKPSDNIAIIAIDDKSLGELGRFPWTRTRYVELLNKLSNVGAKAVLFDVLFPEKESAAIDRDLARALKRAGDVTLAVYYNLGDNFEITSATRSLPELEKAAAGVAHINFLPENDGTNRRNLLLLQDHDQLVPSLGLAGAMAAMGVDKFEANDFDVRVGDRDIPTDANHMMWINYVGPPGSYPVYSFTDILHDRIPAEQLKGKVLFLGATAIGIYDMRVTPFHSNSPGVEVHANVADDIISGRFIQQSGVEALFDIIAILLLGFTTFILTIRLRILVAIPVILLLTVGYFWFTYQMFLEGHWLSMIYPLVVITLTVIIGGGYRYLVLERIAREMRSMFSSYLSPKLVSRLEREPELAKIGGDNKEITVLFTDIKGFTSFSEKHTPQEVVSRLNEYLDAMVQVVDRFDGTVDKFIGDGIMVYWGAPVPQPDHARLAIECLLAMKQTMVQLHSRWEQAGIEPFSLRGGIQSGEVVAGNIGSRGKKMEYTVIGDTVNLAARLEGTAKFYGVEFLVGESTYQRTSDRFRYREIDKMRMVGKKIPVVVYELLGPLSEAPSPLVEEFAQALALYRECRWDEAQHAFREILESYPNDQPSRIYSERCGYFISHPPAQEWDGVFDRLDK